MIEIRQTDAFADWLRTLKDRKAATMVAARLQRLAHGLPGDVAPVGEGLSELRIHYGAGYRVYFVNRGAALIVVLGGGSKRTQATDIRRAKQLKEELET